MSQPEGWKKSLDRMRRKNAKKFGGEPDELLGKFYRSFPAREGHEGFFSYFHRKVDRRHLLVTNGLSNPGAGLTVGRGVEIFVETDEPLGAPIFASWLSNMLSELFHLICADDELVPLVLRHGILSLELLGRGFPPAMRTQSGHVGILLGVPAPGYPSMLHTRQGDIHLLAATTLLPDELTLCLQNRAWNELAARLARAGHHHLSRQWRDPVLTGAIAS